MIVKRFELTMNGNEVAQYEIIDHNQEILTIYNDLGNVYFSSAMKICELLNELNDENEQLKEERNYFERKKCEYFNKYNKKHLDNIQLKKENEQLKKELKRCKDWINSDKYDYELTLAFIKSKGYSLKDVLEYEKGVRE